jgi:DNA-directed RNA polymerase I, II, and III subunit RPABC2
MADKFVESDGDDETDFSETGSESSEQKPKKIKKKDSDDEADQDDDDDDINSDLDDDDVFAQPDDDNDDSEEDNNEMNLDEEGNPVSAGEVMSFSDDESEDEEPDKNHLQKLTETLKRNVITEHHPELIVQNFHEVEEMCVVLRDENGVINDPRHRTVPFITKYEKAKILGERAKQINAGATPFVEVNQEIIDGYLIALAEFEQKKIPMIIRRPLPNNQSEYWRLEDLEIL